MVLARVSPDMFVGREDDVERLYLRAIAGPGQNLVRVTGAPGVGTSEILRRGYDRLFREQRFVIPFYFSLRESDLTAASSASRFVYEFLLQLIAFRKNDSSLIAASPDVCELQKLVPLTDADWVRSVCEACDINGPLNDDRAFVRSALSAPFRAAARFKVRVCVIIDNIHRSAAIEGGSVLIDQIVSNSGIANSALILASRRNFEIPGQFGESVAIEPLGVENAATMIELLAADLGVAVSEQVRDLIADQLEANPAMIRAFLRGAADARKELGSYRDAAITYSDELFRGHLAAHCDRIFERAASDAGARNGLINALSGMIGQKQAWFPLDSLRERSGISNDDFGRTVRSLFVDEVITVSGPSARLSVGSVLTDYIQLRSQIDVERSSEASVRSSLITNFLRRAPERMAREYRRRASVGLQDVLMRFELQDVPRALLDNRLFRDRYLGLSDQEIKSQMSADTETFKLPQFSYAGPLADHLANSAEYTEPERSIVASGFTDMAYREEDEIVWLAAEIDSKLEADPDLTREWADRLTNAAVELGYRRSRLWLVAPEGFSPGALELLAERNAFGSSRRQVELLRATLRGKDEEVDADLKEYELTVPVGEDSELIAVHALEEIARRYEFPLKAVNQVKTALVEASINAAEHGLSPDRRIHQKFGVYPDKIVVTVSNRGLRLIDKLRNQSSVEEDSPDTRRGWGLSLIRSLMDEVRIESVDDGTRIVMTKFMKTPT